MRGGSADLVLLVAGVLLAAAIISILAWLLTSLYLDRVERRLAERKGLYRDLVAELATRERAMLEPAIHQIQSLYDLQALEAVLEEQARSATGRPGWLLEVYDRLGLVDKYIAKLRTARKWRDRAFAAELLGRVGSAKAVPALLETVQATQTEDSDVREIALRALARIADPQAVAPLVEALAYAEPWLAPRIADILARHGEAVVGPVLGLLSGTGSSPARAWAANVLGEVRSQRAFPSLIRGLDDADDEVRAKSATALGRLGDRRAVAALLDRLLTDPAPFVRVRIATALGQLGGPEVIDRLVRALGDRTWWVRMRAVEALEQIGSIAEGPLLVALSDPDPEIRQRAAVSLERLGLSATLLHRMEVNQGAEEATQTLSRLTAAGTRELVAELLVHPSLEVRGTVIRAIREARRSDLVPELGRVALSDPEPAVRRAAFDALRRLRTGSILSVGLAGAADPDPEVRIAAIELIGQAGDYSVIALLRSQANDPDPRIRAAATRALGRVGGRSAQADLSRMLGDPEPLVREATVRAVAEGGHRALVPALTELLLDGDEQVRLATAHALGVLGDRAAAPALLRAFAGGSRDLQRMITLAVSRLAPDVLTELIDGLVEPDDVESRLALAHTLDRLRWPGGLDHLGRLARDPAAEVRAVAVRALGRSVPPSMPPPPALVDAVTDALSDPEPAVRVAAIEVAARKCLEDLAGLVLSLLHRDPSAGVRQRAALATGVLRAAGGDSALMAACRRTEPLEVRAAAVLGAGMYDRSSLMTLMLEMVDESAVRRELRQRIRSDPWFRLVSRSLSRVGAVELRTIAARSEGEARLSLASGIRGVLDAGERVRLLTGLRSFQGEQSRDALLQLLRVDPSAEVRTAALTSVGDLLDPDEVLTFGSRALGDPSVMVRRAAVHLFGRVPPDRAMPRLLQALRLDDDPAVIAAAAGLAEEHFAEFRESVLASPLTGERGVLVSRLARYIHHPELDSVLTVLSRSPATEIREAVAEVWRHRPEAAAAVPLEALTRDPVISVRLGAAGAAAAARRYDLLDRMTQDPEVEVRREVATALGQSPAMDAGGARVLEHLDSDPEMTVRAAAHVGRLLQGIPVPLPPNLDPRIAAEAVHSGADLGALRSTARTAAEDDRRLSAALALALIHDQVAQEVARSDPAPSVRHRVGGALELSTGSPGEPA